MSTLSQKKDSIIPRMDCWSENLPPGHRRGEVKATNDACVGATPTNGALKRQHAVFERDGSSNLPQSERGGGLRRVELEDTSFHVIRDKTGMRFIRGIDVIFHSVSFTPF